MYLVLSNDIVAYNDDYTGLASEIIYTPCAVGNYLLVIRAYTTATSGYCDLYRGIDGTPPVLIESDVEFVGTYIAARWKAGEWFETGGLSFTTDGGGSSDPYLFLFYPGHGVGNQMYRDDDSGPGNHAKIVPPSGGEGTVILGSYSRYSEGKCILSLVGQSYLAPWMSPAPWAARPSELPMMPSIEAYVRELSSLKPALDEVPPDERDKSVLEVQRRLLSKEEIRHLSTAPLAVATDLMQRQDAFLRRYKSMRKGIAELSYDERAARLVALKRETMGPEYAEPADSSTG